MLDYLIKRFRGRHFGSLALSSSSLPVIVAPTLHPLPSTSIFNSPSNHPTVSYPYVLDHLAVPPGHCSGPWPVTVRYRLTLCIQKFFVLH